MDATNPQTSGEVIAAGLTLFWETFVTPVVTKTAGTIKAKAAQHQENQRWVKAAEDYRESLTRHYGTIRVLGATEDTALENVFTQVYTLDQLTAHRRYNIEELQKADAEQLRNSEEKREPVNGLALVKAGSEREFPTNYYILGKPGAGKTTFLKYITIQAANHRAINRIPIFISLHAWARSGGDDLFDFIVTRFDVCQFPNASAFIELLLKEGKAILLFDGLDEVRHERQQRDRLTDQLQDFVQKYDRCQHLITCRIAASEYDFRGFKTVEVADFTPDQIDEYVRNWFGSDVETCAFFLQELKKKDNRGVYELCNMPLLLSMVCLAFASDRRIPPTRLELYEDALEALLRKWDASRKIDRDALHPDDLLYRELSLKRKKELFARIAFHTFAQGLYFFRRRDLERWIAEYLATLPNVKPIEEIDGQIILRAIEAQHGIFMERGKDIYSFSHLTFQEYFTALDIAHNQANGIVSTLFTDHLTDNRWREVFLLTASLLSGGNINDFFRQLRCAIDRLLDKDTALIKLLTWSNKKTISTARQDDSQSAVRLAYVFFALTRVLDRVLTLDRAFALVLDRTLTLAYTLAYSLILDQALALDRSRTITLDRARLLNRERALDRDPTLARGLAEATAPHVGFDYGLFYTWSYAEIFAIKRLNRTDNSWQHSLAAMPRLFKSVVALGEIANLSPITKTMTVMTIPSVNSSPQIWRHFADELAGLLRHRDLLVEWRFDDDQISRLNHYFVANELLVQCLKVAVVSNRQEILAGLLAPPKPGVEIE